MRKRHKDPTDVAKLFLDWAMACRVVELYGELLVLGEPFDSGRDPITGSDYPDGEGYFLAAAADNRQGELRIQAQDEFLRLIGKRVEVPGVGTYEFRNWKRHGDTVVFAYYRPCGLRYVEIFLNFRAAATTVPPRLEIDPEADTSKHGIGRGYLSLADRMAVVDAFLGADE